MNATLVNPYHPALPPLRDEGRTELRHALEEGLIKIRPREECYCGGRIFTLFAVMIAMVCLSGLNYADSAAYSAAFCSPSPC